MNAAVKRLPRKDPHTAAEVDREVAHHERLQQALDESGHQHSPYVLELLDVKYSTGERDFTRVPHRSDDVYLFFTPLGNTSLKEHATTHTLSPTTKLTLFYQAVRGVAVLHNVKFVHGDIKPPNIGVRSVTSDASRAFIIDLGRASEPRGYHISTNPGHGGTLGFLAPKQEAPMGNIYGREVDVFALGCVGYWLLENSYIISPWIPNPWRQDRAAPLERKLKIEEFTQRRARLAEAPAGDFRSSLCEMLEVDPRRRIDVRRVLGHAALRASWRRRMGRRGLGRSVGGRREG